jgi:ferredoxin
MQRPTLFSRLFQRMFGLAPAPYSRSGSGARVAADPARCVQCGVCGYNCPAGIPVRDYACRGLPVDDPRCVQCGQCIEVCPRGTLRWDRPIEIQLLPIDSAAATPGSRRDWP